MKKNIWAEKNQLQCRDISDFLRIMKNGKVIHILRDPRAANDKYGNTSIDKIKL